jgi:hypothetical protein
MARAPLRAEQILVTWTGTVRAPQPPIGGAPGLRPRPEPSGSMGPPQPTRRLVISPEMETGRKPSGCTSAVERPVWGQLLQELSERRGLSRRRDSLHRFTPHQSQRGTSECEPPGSWCALSLQSGGCLTELGFRQGLKRGSPRVRIERVGNGHRPEELRLATVG